MSSSNERAEQLILELQSRDTATWVIESIICSLCTATAFVGNTLVLLAAYRNSRLRTPSHSYIIALAAGDFTMAAIPLSFVCYFTISGKKGLRGIPCQIQGFLAYFCVLFSMFLFTLIAINRYFKMIHPIWCRRYFTYNKTIGSIIGAGVLAFGCSISLIYTAGLVYNPGMLGCTTDHETVTLTHVLVIAIAFTGIPFSVTYFCYFKLWLFLRNHSKRMVSSQVNIQELNTTRMLFLVVSAFTLFMSPMIVIQVIEAFKGQFSLPRQVYFFVSIMICFANSANPVIYGVLNRDFKREFASMFGLLKCNRELRPSKVQVKASVSIATV